MINFFENVGKKNGLLLSNRDVSGFKKNKSSFGFLLDSSLI